MPNTFSARLIRYSFAGLVTVLILLLKLWLELYIEIKLENPFLLFFPAIVFSALYGGFGPGLLATIATALFSYYSFADPNYSLLIAKIGQTIPSENQTLQPWQFFLSPNQNLQLGLFAFQGAVFSYLGKLYLSKNNFFIPNRDIGKTQQAEESLPAAYEEIEKLIEERTAQLRENNALLQDRILEYQRSIAALHCRAQDLKAILENAPDAIARFDKELRFVYVNKLVEQILGLSRETLIGKTSSDLLMHNEICVFWEANINKVFATSTEREMEFELETDLGVRFYQARLMPEFNAEEIIEYVLVVSRDITDNKRAEQARSQLYAARLAVYFEEVTNRKQAQEALRESEERLRLALDAGNMGIWDWNIVTGDLKWSDNLEPIHGFAPGTFGGTFEAFAEIIHPEDREFVMGAIAKALEQKTSYNMEFRIVGPDGKLRWMAGKGKTFCDADGKAVRMIGVGMDISDRKRAETAQKLLLEASTLLATSLDYETTLKNLAQVAVPTLADWCIVDIFQPDASLRQITIACADPAKQEILEQLRRRYPPNPKQANSAWQKLLGGESIIYTEFTDSDMVAIAQNEEHLHLLRSLGNRSVMIVPIRSRQQVLGVVSFVSSASRYRYDRSDLALAEDIARRAATAIDNAYLYREAQEANRLKDEFLAILSHELRTPLNAILGWSQILRNRQCNEAITARALETIERNARLQTQLIEDLLDVSRIMQGKLSLNMRPLNLTSVIEAAINTVRPSADAKGIQLETVFSPGSGLIRGDGDRLQQVIWNLLSNAIKFTPNKGKVAIRLEVTDACAQIKVTDTGKGIDADFLPHVFERFRQADSSMTRSHGGLGLGLAIVLNLVELHGGTVKAESPGIGKGATFTVNLPLLETKNFD